MCGEIILTLFMTEQAKSQDHAIGEKRKGVSIRLSTDVLQLTEKSCFVNKFNKNH